MNAFVLSGGGNLGSIQAGMIEALLEVGIYPDVLVGTSIGAANAAFLAADPSLAQARELSELWRRVRTTDIFPIRPLRAVRAFLRGEAMFPTEPFRRFLDKELPYSRIEEAAIPLRVVATDFDDGSEVVFASGSVTDSILASTALPGVFAPYDIDGHLYLDGGLIDYVPVGPALAAGGRHRLRSLGRLSRPAPGGPGLGQGRAHALNRAAAVAEGPARRGPPARAPPRRAHRARPAGVHPDADCRRDDKRGAVAGACGLPRASADLIDFTYVGWVTNAARAGLRFG
ncbi:MAG: patatin-like phospholipase family protein [Chloroflexia bacterium]|nr:patatin-like phospholipase family protein [Chloroflexia bacterium]